MKTAFPNILILIVATISFSQNPQQEIEKWRNIMQNFTPQQAEQNLRQGAGFQTYENDLGSLIDQQRQQDILDLFQMFKSKPVREFTCYQVRKIKVNTKWKCSSDGRLYEDEPTCKLNCMKQYKCSQLPCYTVAYCERLGFSGKYVCPINKTRCKAQCIGILGHSSCSYSCPLGDYPCVEDIPGVAYCSPFKCVGNINGKSYCMTGNITSPINANVIGMWWCSGDRTWLTTQKECMKNCPYYTCEMNGKVYTGLDTCKVNCREVYPCEVF